MKISKKTILVVDDHESLRKLIGRFLSRQYDVTTQADGLKALAWLRRGNIPDLIVLDMTMPKLSGLQFLSNIRSSGFFKAIPVVVISGEEGEDVVDQCEKLKVQKYIFKPFNPVELNDLIDSILQPDSKTDPVLI